MSKEMERRNKIELERQNKICENWLMNGLNKPVVISNSADRKRNNYKIENKHQGIKQTRSLDIDEKRTDGRNRYAENGVEDKVRKHHASEKIRRSTSSKYKNEGLEHKHEYHKHNVHRSDKKRCDKLEFIDAFDFSGEQSGIINNQGTRTQKLSSLNKHHEDKEEHNLSKRHRSNSSKRSDESQTHKSVRENPNEMKRHKEKARYSSVNAETSANELYSHNKKRRSRSKRKEIHTKQPTFYGLSGKDLELPLSTSVVPVKGDKRQIPKRSADAGIITSKFSVLEIGDVDHGERRDGSVFQRKNCCLISVLSAISLILAGVVTALLIMFLTDGDSSDGKKFDMLRAHVKLRIINKKYTDKMSNHSDISFTSIARPFCEQVDYLFITSKLHNEYFGCETKQLSTGSVKLYYVTPFLNTDQSRNVTNIKRILSVPADGKQSVKDSTVYHGDFLVDVNSINIVLENYQIDNLPQRPRLILNDISHGKATEATTYSVSKEAETTTESWSSPTTTDPFAYFYEDWTTTEDAHVSRMDSSSVAPTSVSIAGSSHKTALKTSTGTTSASPHSSTSDVPTTVLKPSRQSTIASTASTIHSTTLVTESPTASLSTSTILPKFSPTLIASITHRTLSTHIAAIMPGFSPTPTEKSFGLSSLPTSRSTSNLASKVLETTTKFWSPPTTTDDFAYFYEDWTTTEEVLLPSIKMTGAEVYLNDKHAQLRCIVEGLKAYSGQISIFYQKTKEVDPKTLLTLINKGDLYSKIYQNIPESLVINHTTKDYVVTIDLNFTQVGCTDVGYYTCELRSQGNLYSDTGYLKGFALPDKPTLLIQSSIIEGQELLQPITCTSHVGYPPGYLRFEIKPRGHTTFFPLQNGNTITSGTCGTNKTISLMYTPTKDANGTLLKCVVDSKHAPHERTLSSIVELKVIPANICDAHGENKTVRHPFECNKYLICHGKYFEIQECDNGVCYDQETEKCGQTSLEMNDVIAYLNEGVASLKCHLTHTGAWDKITISKADPWYGTKMEIVTIRNGQEPIIHNTTMKDRLFANIERETRYELGINVWLYKLTCEDQGEYFCEVDAPMKLATARGNIDIRVKPTAPSLSIPSAIVEGLPVNFNFTCEADVGFPHGRLIVKTKLQNETDFKALWIRDEVIEEETNCSKVVRRTFQFIPSMAHNGMTIMCEVHNPATLPEGHTMVTTHTIHIVPGNFCKTHADSTAHVHPYDCHQYVQCSDDYIYVQRCGSDHCFDPETLRCDLPDLHNKHTFDPNYPCRPNQNGVFFHHPFLCNKYIWCVQGEEIVQHCPIGTLYIDSGQCTFDVDQSRCYKTKDQTSIT